MSNLPLISIRVSLAGLSPDGREIAAMMDRIVHPNETLRNSISLGLQMLALRVQKERFTGQGPFPVADKKLGVKSGRLSRDLHAEPAAVTGNGYSGRIGTAVEYFAAHELGFEGEVSVRAHVRSAHTLSKKKITNSKGKVQIRPAQSRLEQSVRAHKRKVKIPKREPLRTGIEQHAPAILRTQIRKGLEAITNAKP